MNRPPPVLTLQRPALKAPLCSEGQMLKSAPTTDDNSS
jgi:hypothetical protein